jgi:ethanolamine ammonia-lyase small subunit
MTDRPQLQLVSDQGEVQPDPWARFRGATRARIALGRSGDGLPTKALLEFQLAHAQARDAVHGAVDFAGLAASIAPLSTVEVESQAADRLIYLRRPDLGRRLSPASLDRLSEIGGACDIAFIIGDGLSAAAVTDHAAATLKACLERLGGWTVGPITLAKQARVALGDEIGAALNARLSIMLIGERPGLSVANSLGIYLTWGPRPGRSDAERNCISNIHADGLSYDQAADKLAWLAGEALRHSHSGVALKEDATPATPITAPETAP